MTTAGMLNREITIEYPTLIDGEYGPQPGPWLPLVRDGVGSPIIGKRFAAEVQDALPSRAESVQQGLAVARNQVRVRLRYRDDVNSAMRIRLHGDGDDQIMQIVGGPASVGGRKAFMEVVCEKIS